MLERVGAQAMAQNLSRRDFVNSTGRVALAAPFLSLVGCVEEQAGELLSLGGNTMGTTYSVKMVAPASAIDRERLAQKIEAKLEGVNRRMSTYLPESEVSRLNAAPLGEAVEVSRDTRLVLDEALRINELTGGAFDPTVGPLVDLWGFGPRGGRGVPSPDDVAKLRNIVGLDKLYWQGDGAGLVKRVDGLQVDLSGIAKGFAVDQLADLLDGEGAADYLVEVGGELRSKGRAPGGRAWRVGIEKPALASGDLQRIIDFEGAALATSGNYRIFFEQDGQNYCHIIDPVKGRPVEHRLASVTVVADSTMTADALSTALLVLGAEAGMRLAKAENIAAFFISGAADSYSSAASPAFEERFKA